MESEYKTCKDLFDCQMCGQCCKGFGGTYVSRADRDKIAAYIQSDPETFTREYCDPSGSRWVLTRGSDGCCIFFDTEKQCTIHPVKPYMCRAWPFIQTLIRAPENWNIMAGSCPGIKQNVPREAIVRIVKAEKKKLDNAFYGKD